MPHTAQKIWVLLFALLLCACSSSKEPLEGKRISVLMTGNNLSSSKSQVQNIIIGNTEKNSAWTQTAMNAAHLQQNLMAAPDMQSYASFDAGKGASKKAPLLSSPVADDQAVYVQDRTGTVFAFDLKTKERLFKQKLKASRSNDSLSEMNGVGLALKDSSLFALTGAGSVFSLDKKSGQVLWQKDLQVPLRTPPTVAENILFVQTIDNEL